MPRREEFLDAALLRFSTHGFAAASTRDICADVGIAHSAIYNYFPTKGAILRALEERELKPFLARAEELLAAHHDSPPLEKLERLLNFTIGVAIERRAGWTLFQDMLRHLNKEDWQVFVDHRTRYESLVRTAIAEAISRGVLPPQEVGLVTFYFFGMVDGIVRWYKPSGKLKPDELARNTTRFFIAALAAGVSLQ